jgi:putative flippase GtrA
VRIGQTQVQAARFLIAGGFVALVSFTLPIGLHTVGLPFQVALAVTVVIALILHFSLQRLFVWKSEEAYDLDQGQQAWRYLAIAAVQYAVIALITATIPKLLGVRVTFVYLVALALLGVVNFVILRNRVFQSGRNLELQSGLERDARWR